MMFDRYGQAIYDFEHEDKQGIHSRNSIDSLKEWVETKVSGCFGIDVKDHCLWTNDPV
jgi:hypothetical protein